MMNRRLFMFAAVASLAAGSVIAVAPWQGSRASDTIFNGTTDGVAINGYDPVGYFTDNAPVKGSSDFTTEYKGAVWQFASAENRDLFTANPKKYAPQYGGYCAFAVAHNQLAKTEPDAFSIVDGKLYLNYDLSIRQQWEGDKTSFIPAADGYWPELQPK